MIANELSIEDTADRRGVTLATAKTLLQRAYQKTDVSKATELARLVAELPVYVRGGSRKNRPLDA
jgi:DNA-binding CsgD family transcriptional regulator